jgi:hypothetical protein
MRLGRGQLAARGNGQTTPRSRTRRLAHHAVRFSVALTVAVSLGGCPGGAELENPDQNMQYFSGAPGVGGTTGGAGQGGSPTGGAGTAGGAGTGSANWTWNCATPLEGPMGALKQNCARGGCHDQTSRYAGLNLTDPSTIRGQMVDQIATHGDMSCGTPGMTHVCTPDEIVALGCPLDVKLIDSANFSNSWVVAKINQTHGNCGLYMPFTPGNSATNGWNDERMNCYMDFFRSLATPP